MATITRREFTKAAAVVGMTAAVSAAVGASSAQTTPSERVRLGFIGLGNRGDQNLKAFQAHKDAQIVAICDLYQPYLDLAASKIEGKPQQFKDYRKLLDRKDIDAVVISTPDHWHALQMIDACAAGKDVYVEKPLSLCVKEGRAMVDAAAKYQRVTQVGTQRRSQKICQEMVQLIRDGAIGKVTMARAFHIQNEGPKGIGRPADSDPPANLDWDAWVGPAAMKPYNVNRTFYRFRWFFDYSGGQMTNTGVHYMDLIRWALNETAPTSVAAMGGKFGDFDDREIPDTMEALWTYPSGTLVTFSQINANSAGATAKPAELEFRGTKGTLYFHGDAYEIVPENVLTREYPVLSPLDRAGAKGWRSGPPAMEPAQARDAQDPSIAHARNFLDWVKSRAKCNADIETGHRSTTPTLLANIAYKTRSTLDWDAKAERFTNSDAANAMLSYEYRKPYVFPNVG